MHRLVKDMPDDCPHDRLPEQSQMSSSVTGESVVLGGDHEKRLIAPTWGFPSRLPPEPQWSVRHL